MGIGPIVAANGRFLAGLLSYLSLNRHVTGEALVDVTCFRGTGKKASAISITVSGGCFDFLPWRSQRGGV